MIKQIRKLACCGLAAAAALAAADASYVGKWKMNVAKSDFGDTTITFAQAPSGGMQMTVDGQTYSFKTDGKDYDGMFGSKMSWRMTEAGAWEATNKMGGKVLSTDTYKVTADGKSLSLVSKGTSPAGSPFETVHRTDSAAKHQCGIQEGGSQLLQRRYHHRRKARLPKHLYRLDRRQDADRNGTTEKYKAVYDRQ